MTEQQAERWLPAAPTDLDEKITKYYTSRGWVSPMTRLVALHLDGVMWLDAPIPSRFHRCTPQTRGVAMSIERCACGGLRYDGNGPWIQRNSRRKKKS